MVMDGWMDGGREGGGWAGLLDRWMDGCVGDGVGDGGVGGRYGNGVEEKLGLKHARSCKIIRSSSDGAAALCDFGGSIRILLS